MLIPIRDEVQSMETRNRTFPFRGLVVDIEQMDVRIGHKGWHTFQVVRHPGGVGVLPLHDDGTVTDKEAAHCKETNSKATAG